MARAAPEPTTPMPERVESFLSPGIARAKTLTLVFTGLTEGYLENCGCKGTQSGGLARRVSLVRKLRQSRPRVVLLDAGSTFSRTDKQPTLDTLSREELRFSLETIAALRYDAIAVGTTELIYGLPTFQALGSGLDLPWVAASVQAAHASLAPSVRTFERGGLRIAVIGLLEPSRGLDNDARFEDATAGLKVDDVVERARPLVASLSSRVDVVIALGKLGPVVVRRLVAACPDLDVVVTTDDELPIPRANGETRDRSGFLGRTLVAYTDQTRYGVNLASLDVGLDGRLTGARLEGIRLDEHVPDDPDVRGRLTSLYERIGRLDAAQGGVIPPFAGDSLRTFGVYVGARVCANCHAPEYVQWRSTPHGTAFKTLLDVHRHYQPRCVSCHVVGFGTPTGYRMGTADERVANVQCEVCHGPGARHFREPSARTIIRQVPEAVCVACHTPDHSNHFVYRERLPRVLHTTSMASR